jgi:hypothetical protein
MSPRLAIGPVAGGKVPVFNQHCNGATHGEAVTHPGLDDGVISLNLHPSAPAIPGLAAGQVIADVCLADRQAGWQSLYNGYETRAVRFTGG